MLVFLNVMSVLLLTRLMILTSNVNILRFDETYNLDKQRDLLAKCIIWLVGASAPLVLMIDGSCIDF